MPPTHCAVPGTLLNANTLDDFKERDKAALLQGVARAIWDDVASGAGGWDGGMYAVQWNVAGLQLPPNGEKQTTAAEARLEA